MPSSGIGMGGGMPYPPIITTLSLPAATQNVSYSAQLTAINGFPPYNWTLVSGPVGLSVSSNGNITWTPTTPGPFNLTVNLTDSMGGTPNAPSNLQVSVAANFLITTSSPLPGANVGTAYTVTFAAMGGIPPYAWIATSGLPSWATLNGTTGVMSGTPTGAETDSIGVQVQDSSVPSLFATKTFALTVTGTVAPGAPQAMWPGYVATTSLTMQAWGPSGQTTWTSGAPDYYKVYRDGALYCGGNINTAGLTNPGITASAAAFGSPPVARPVPYFTDTGLTPGSTHTYRFSAVTGGVEGPQGPTLTMTALATGSSVLPTPAIDPVTWVQDGTGALNINSSVLPPGLTPVVCNSQATFISAMAAAALAGPNIIALDPTGAYAIPNQNGFIPPAFTGASGWTIVISTEAPEYKAYTGGTGGKLPAYKFTTGDFDLLPLNCTGTIAAGATSATLAAPWPNKSGWYYVEFNESPFLYPDGTPYEERLCVFLKGQSTFTWNLHNENQPINTISTGTIAGGSGYTAGTYVLNLTGGSGTGAGAVAIVTGGAVASFSGFFGGNNYAVNDVLTATFGGGSGFSFTVTAISAGGPGLKHTAIPTIQVSYTDGVTPWDAYDNVAMPTIEIGSVTNAFGLNLPQALTKVRFIGINIHAGPNTAGQATGYVKFANSNFGAPQTPANHVYFDRCIWGSLPGSASYGFCGHGLETINCDHLFVNQCYSYGVLSNFIITGGDSNNGGTNGNSHCWQNNYLSCGAENILMGGGYSSQTDPVSDMVVRRNISHKPLDWVVGAVDGSAGVLFGPYGLYGHSLKNHFELKVGNRIQYYQNVFINCWVSNQPGYHGSAITLGARDQIYGGSTAGTNFDHCNPWNNVSDVDIHDNRMWRISTMVYVFTADVSPSAYTARIRIVNNAGLISPPLTQNERIMEMIVYGPCTDYICQHNTWIVNQNMTFNQGLPIGFDWFAPSNLPGWFFGNAPPAAPFTWDKFQDRQTIADNIIDCGGSGWAFSRGAGLPTLPWLNQVWTKNAVLTDPVVYGNGNYSGVTYTTAGFQNFQGSNIIPLHTSDWNVVSGTLLSGSTTGGSVGYRQSSGASLFLGNSLQGISTTITSSDSQDTFFQFTGTDGKYGNQLPRAAAGAFLFGGTGGNDQVQQTCTSKLGSGYSADIVESIATDNTVPAGVSSTVRVSTLTNPFDQTVHTQNSYLINPGSGTPGMVYVSHWIWLQADMTSRTNNANHFGEFVEFKTGPGNTDVERFQIGYEITANPNNNWTGFGNTPVFIMLHDQAGSAVPNQEILYFQIVISPSATQSTWGQFQTHAAPIPLGRWFRLEWAFNRSDSSGQGWMWAALTDPGSTDPALQAGVQFWAARGAFNASGQTLGCNQALANAIDRIFIDNTNYTDISRSSSSTYVIKTTDYQVYAGWPSNASAHPANYL